MFNPWRCDFPDRYAQYCAICHVHNIKHNKVLHERNIMVTVITRDIPFVPQEDRIQVEKLDDRFYRITMYYGFRSTEYSECLETSMSSLSLNSIWCKWASLFRVIGLCTPVGDGMSPWREKLFISMQRNTSPVSDFYQNSNQPCGGNWVVKSKFKITQQL